MDPNKLATLLSVHQERYTPSEQLKLKKAIADTVNLANDDETSDFGNNKTGAGQAKKKGQAGKTRSQPRQYGGKFGKKGKNNGEQGEPDAPQIDPEQIIGTINNLQMGQSVALLGNNAKVKRLGSGYQLYKADGTENRVVKSLQEATTWARSVMKRAPKGGGANK